jgi:hypothetical protein
MMAYRVFGLMGLLQSAELLIRSETLVEQLAKFAVEIKNVTDAGGRRSQLLTWPYLVGHVISPLDKYVLAAMNECVSFLHLICRNIQRVFLNLD